MTPPDIIDVYDFTLEPGDGISDQRMSYLSVEEIERASRFKFERHRIAWVLSRVALRKVLAHHVGVDAKDIQFIERPDGKPQLRNRKAGDVEGSEPDDNEFTSRPPVFFNLSHSGKHVLIAVSNVREVGCDVEHVKRIRDWKAVTRRFFSMAEQKELAGLPESDRPHAFYLCWTRKEAVIKATGEGLRADLHSFDVSLTPGAAAKVYADRRSAVGVLPWQLYHINVSNEYVGAVATRATEAPPVRVHRLVGVEGNVRVENTEA